MNAVRNYQKELDNIITALGEDGKEVPTLFLHSCCAPCSSYVLEYLRKYFRITVFYYNPNITEEEEYRKRAAEQKKLIAAYNEKALCVRGEDGSQHGYYIDVMEGDYEPQRFFEIARGLERCPEGKERCFACYALRLRETAQRAEFRGCRQISRRRTGIKGLSSCRRNMDCTGRIIAAVSIPAARGSRRACGNGLRDVFL